MIGAVTMAFVIALALFAVALYALSRLKQKDLHEAAAAVGLSRVAHSPGIKGTTAEGRPCRDTDVARGSIAGLTATLMNRSTPSVLAPKRKRVATQFTILSLHLPSPPPAALRLQPVGWSRGLEAFTQSPPVVVPTGDATFDAVWHLYTDAPTAALLVLTPEVRASLVAWRNACVPKGPAWTEHASSALLLGSFEITPDRAKYVLFSSPSGKTGAHVASTVTLLTTLAGR